MRRGRWRQAVSVYAERPVLPSSVGWKAERGQVLVMAKCQLKESERHHGDDGEPR